MQISKKKVSITQKNVKISFESNSYSIYLIVKVYTFVCDKHIKCLEKTRVR